ncbi:lipopolysaccharide biosynthesis protein [Pedobacter sp. JCM 36344]|uniref:lipopolysaccharide biosynthesis protein n=1 Tax=Pedobacter sp. JCM 36344 TaxID=3374280 RepID=UPI00397C6820
MEINLKVEERNPENPDEISVKDLILRIRRWRRYILSHWVFVFGFGILGAGLGFTYSYIKKPIYIATTTFVLEDDKEGGGLGSIAGLASFAGLDLGARGGGIFQGDNILELYKSRSMIEKTLLSKLDGEKGELLVNRYINVYGLRESWNNNPQLSKLKFSDDGLNFRTSEFGNIFQRTRDSVLSEIVDNIRRNYLLVSKPDKKVSIIRVDVRSSDELFSKAFNDILVRNVNEFYVQTKTKKSLENISILQKKTDSVRNVMNDAIYFAVAIADATPNLNPTKQIKRLAPAQRSQYSAETNKAVVGELVKNLEMSKISLLKEAPLIQVVDQPIYPLTIEKIGRMKGLVLGGFLMTMISIIFLTARKLYKKYSLND